MEKKCYMEENAIRRKNAIWRKMLYGGKCHTEETVVRRKNVIRREKRLKGEK